MDSKVQKILHQVGGKPMVTHAVDEARKLSAAVPTLVVGVGGDGVRALFGDSVNYVVQREQMGTGHAVMVAKEMLQGQSSQLIVTYADMPLLRGETMAKLAALQREQEAAVAVLSVMGDPNSSFGRIVRNAANQVTEIIEVAEAKQRPDPETYLSIPELNAGIYCFDADFLWQHIDELPLRKARKGHEYYLTDMVAKAVEAGRTVVSYVAEDADECLGAGTRAELVAVEAAFRERANRHWLANGVTIINPSQTYIDQGVAIGQDTIIWPGSYIQGQSIIGADCIIGPNAIVRDATVGAGCRVEQAMVENVTLPDHTNVSP